MFKLSTNSSNIDIFTQNKHDYEMSLKNSTYKAKLVYKTTDETLDVCNRRNNRERKILWFTPPYNIAMANKLGKEYLHYKRKTFLH